MRDWLLMNVVAIGVKTCATKLLAISSTVIKEWML